LLTLAASGKTEVSVLFAGSLAAMLTKQLWPALAALGIASALAVGVPVGYALRRQKEEKKEKAERR
jgi:hypothetical protein